MHILWLCWLSGIGAKNATASKNGKEYGKILKFATLPFSMVEQCNAGEFTAVEGNQVVLSICKCPFSPHYKRGPSNTLIICHFLKIMKNNNSCAVSCPNLNTIPGGTNRTSGANCRCQIWGKHISPAQQKHC